MNKVITDEQFNIALANQDNQAIMHSACVPFRKNIDRDELHSIKLMSLWAALKTWNRNGRKFTSFLYQAVRWNCIKFVQDKAKNPVYNMEFDRQEKKSHKVEEMLEILPLDLRDIMIKRYVHCMTLRELAKAYGCCAETARRKILKSLSILRENH